MPFKDLGEKSIEAHGNVPEARGTVGVIAGTQPCREGASGGAKAETWKEGLIAESCIFRIFHSVQ